MDHHPTLEEVQKRWHGSYRAYAIGMIGCLLLTIGSFLAVSQKLLQGSTLIGAICTLALVQAIVQLKFFLHMGEEEKPSWEKLVFYFMLTLLIIVVIGSLWIMFDLNERMMGGMKAEMHHD